MPFFKKIVFTYYAARSILCNRSNSDISCCWWVIYLLFIHFSFIDSLEYINWFFTLLLKFFFVYNLSLGFHDLGFSGSQIKTPNLDRLRNEGLLLTNYHVTPICTPSRGALMTGRYPLALGLQVSIDFNYLIGSATLFIIFFVFLLSFSAEVFLGWNDYPTAANLGTSTWWAHVTRVVARKWCEHCCCWSCIIKQRFLGYFFYTFDSLLFRTESIDV